MTVINTLPQGSSHSGKLAHRNQRFHILAFPILGTTSCHLMQYYVFPFFKQNDKQCTLETSYYSKKKSKTNFLLQKSSSYIYTSYDC